MSSDPKSGPKRPHLSPSGQRAEAKSRARQAAALRENLGRRKQQTRARAAAAAEETKGKPD
jgi:hypothetical protein